MRPLIAAVDRAPTIASHATTAMSAVVLVLGFQVSWWIMLGDPLLVMQGDLPLQLGLLATYGVAFFGWMSLRAFGFVGEGSGAGFRLVLLGLGARIYVTLLVHLTGAEAARSIYDDLPVTAGPVWWARNGSLIAYGCGLALVVLAAGTDLVRRRRGPRWASTID